MGLSLNLQNAITTLNIITKYKHNNVNDLSNKIPDQMTPLSFSMGGTV